MNPEFEELDESIRRAWYIVTKGEGAGLVNLSQFGIKEYEQAGYTVTKTSAPWEEE